MTQPQQQKLPTAMEGLMAPYPNLLMDLRIQVYHAIHTQDPTPCIDRVLWAIEDTLTAMIADANAESKKAENVGDIDLSEAHQKRRRALSMAGSYGHGMRDIEAIRKLCDHNSVRTQQ